MQTDGEPVRRQQEQAVDIGATCRAVWNTGLEQRLAFRRRGAYVSHIEQARQLAAAKKEHPWLKESPSRCLQQALMDLDKMCRTVGTFKVRWRSERRWRPSFRFPEGGKIKVERLGRKVGRAKLPKLGWVKFRWPRGLDGVVRSATVSRDGKHWNISFLADDHRTTPQVHDNPHTAVGIDHGVKIAVTTSHGDMHDRTFATVGEIRRARRLQQRQLAALGHRATASRPSPLSAASGEANDSDERTSGRNRPID